MKNEKKDFSEKKEYVAPEMNVIEYDCQGTLLDGSNCEDDGAVCMP